MKRQSFSPLLLSLLTASLLGPPMLHAWTPFPVQEDHLLFMPGSQQGSVSLESANRCDNCHGGYNTAVEPAHNWRGSMMAHAARDPLWAACLTVALQDSIWILGTPNAGDLCIRCHTPTGWLGGHSDPPNLTQLSGSDFEGISCDACHKMTDPFLALMQSEDLETETDPTAITEADRTYSLDFNVLAPLTLFDGSSFFDQTTSLPAHFGLGASVESYIESTSGQYFMDATTPKRGPRWDATPKHQWLYSRFHKTKYFCGTCHDVSNPVLGRVLNSDMALPEQQAAASYAHVERTFSEFMSSGYGQTGGAEANATLNLPAGTMVSKCQDCHMRNVTGASANKAGTQTRTDLALHDQTGGNVWISGILASADQNNPALFDAYNYAILSGAKYSGAQIDVAGIQNHGAALKDGQERARQQLQMAADLVLVSEDDTNLTLRIINNTGHKLISGFPEGRRMWLNVKFFADEAALGGEINPYAPLVVSTDPQGNEQYSGGILTKNRDDLVYETEMMSSVTGEEHTFHFVLATDSHKDNRIPPKGFTLDAKDLRLVVPWVEGVNSPNLFTPLEYAGGYDEVVIDKPAGTTRWEAALYYQTTSREYVEFLRDEIEGTGGTLASPTPSGEASAYIVQADPYFATLKDWGIALYDLWLHNEGCPPVLMASLGTTLPCDAPATPTGFEAIGGKRKITLSWTAVEGADGYNIYYEQGGKYTLCAQVVDATTTTYTDTGLQPGDTYSYVAAAFKLCEGNEVESAYTAPVTATATRR